MNSSQGITPTVELATTNGGNGFYPYPVYPMMGGFGGNSGFGGDGGWLWIIVILALLGGFGNNGNGGFFGGNSNDFAWLSNGQKDIMTNTNNGFDTLHLSNQLEGTRDGIYSLSNQLCNCCADMNSTVSNGFFNAEIAENNRQMANMNQLFGISTQLCNASADNRLGIANLTSTVISENCADREALSNGIRDIISSNTSNTQRILDQLCQDKIDAKNEKIADLQRELQMADLRASQVAQTADIRANNALVANQLVSELRACPIPAQPVYGNQPIFTCPNNYWNNGCGCNGSGNFI